MNDNRVENKSENKNCLYYMLPKALFLSTKYKTLSLGAKVLYSLLYDRSRLSEMNNWTDDNGKIFIYFTIDEICEVIACSRPHAVKLLKELDKKGGAGLIERKYQGQGKPNRIYITPITN